MLSLGSKSLASRRRFLAAVVGIASLSALQACGSSAPAATSSPAAQPTAASQSAAAKPTTAAAANPTTVAAKPTTAAAASAPTATPAAAAPPAAQATPGGFTSTGSKGQIHVVYWADQNDLFKKLVQKFTQETNIGITYEVAPADYLTWQQLITTRMVSHDTNMDAFHADDFQAAIYGSAGWLEALDPIVKQFNIDLSDWPKALLTQVSSWSGKLYRLPWGNDTEIWFYRTDFFKDAGVEPPKDWNGFIEVGKKLTKAPDRWGTVLAAKPNGVLGNDIEHWTNQAGGGINRLDDPGSKEAIKFYKDLFKTQQIAPPSSPQDDYTSDLQNFLHNKCAMWWCWDGFLGTMRQTKDFWKDQVSAFLPFAGPKNSQTITGAWGWSISTYSQKKDLAAEWFNFVNKPENMKQQMWRGRVPARISLWTDKDVQENAPSTPFVKQAYEAGALHARPVTPSIQQIYDAAEHAISAYLTDQVDLNTAVNDAMTKIKAIEAKANKQ